MLDEGDERNTHVKIVVGSHDCSILFAFKVMANADGVANLLVIRFMSLGIRRRVGNLTLIGPSSISIKLKSTMVTCYLWVEGEGGEKAE